MSGSFIPETFKSASGQPVTQDNRVARIRFEDRKVRYETIKSILEVPAPARVCDFETEADSHTFVAGDGFIVSNCSMAKHAISIYHSAYMARFDTTVRVMAYPSRPLFETQISRQLRLTDYPAGDTVIVAIMTYGGYNQEDALIFNRASLDAGKFRNVIYRSYTSVEQRITGIEERIGLPADIKPEDIHLYSALDEYGVAVPGRKVVSGQIIIAKTRLHKRTDKPEKLGTTEKANTVLGPSEDGIVHSVLVDKNPDGNKIVRVRIRQMRTPEIGDKLACASSDHEVLTWIRGWIPIDQLTLNDQVAIMNAQGQLEYEHPSAIHVYDHDGDMYLVESQQVELCVTLNHRMYIQKRDKKVFELVQASEIVGKRVKYKKNVVNAFPDVPTFDLPAHQANTKAGLTNFAPKTLPMDEWLVFLGIWIAEGCADDVHVYIAAYKQRVKDALTACCNVLGLTVNQYWDKKTPGYHRWTITDHQLASYLQQLSVGSTNKRLPGWCFCLSERQSRLLLGGLMLGDGHVSQGNCNTYYTSSKGLADDVTVLALHSGWSGNMFKRFEAGHSVWLERDQNYITTTADGYTITIVKTKNEPQMNHGHAKKQHGQSEGIIHYTGKVYCCTVSSGVFYVRRNGKACWTGNSRHAQKSTVGMIFSPEDMPTTIDGVRPDVIINPHCCTGDTLVTCQSGVSRPISRMELEGGDLVWSWNEKNQGLMVARQTEMVSKGEREVLRLTLEDGRTLKCTPEHKILTVTDGEYKYIEAEKIDMTNSRIVMGLEGAVDDPTEEDRLIERAWKLKCEEHDFSMIDVVERERTLAFARLLGLVCSDGSVSDGLNGIEVIASLGHEIDCQSMIDDIALITGKRPKYNFDARESRETFGIHIPAELARSIGHLPGMTIGKRSGQDAMWPKFLLANDCPKSILREFLGGLFGGDGHAPHLARQQYMDSSLDMDRENHKTVDLVPVKFSQHICKTHLNSMSDKMKQLCDMLYRVGILRVNLEGPFEERYATSSYRPKDYKENPRVEFVLRIKSIPEFTKLVGFRYCIQKSCMLTAANSYCRYQESVKDQYEEILRRARDLYVNDQMTQGKALAQAIKESTDNRGVINAYYAKPSIHMFRNRLPNENFRTKKFDYKQVDDVVVFLKKIGCLPWFDNNQSSRKHYVVSREMNFVPTFSLKLLDRRSIGVQEVFDISVAGNESFVAGGAVIGNCVPTRMTIAKLIEFITSKVAALQGERINATAFRPFSVDEFKRNLVQYGYNEYGNEVLMNPNGKKYQAQIYFGPCYYQALRHQVKDKFQMRSRGAVRPITMQPIHGRKQGGAIRSTGLSRETKSRLVCSVAGNTSWSGNVFKLPVLSHSGNRVMAPRKTWWYRHNRVD